MIYSLQEDEYGLYANTTPFYVRDLSIFGCWCPWGSWYQYPLGTEGQQYFQFVSS